MSAAALYKARAKIGWEAFRKVFEQCAALSPVGKLCQCYESLAVDGMKGEMPNLPTLKETYSGQRPAKLPDVPRNETFLTALFHSAPADGREMVMELLNAESVKGRKAIRLFEREFPCVALIQKPEETGMRFVMRVSADFLTEASDFARSGAVDKLLSVERS